MGYYSSTYSNNNYNDTNVSGSIGYQSRSDQIGNPKIDKFEMAGGGSLLDGTAIRYDFDASRV